MTPSASEGSHRLPAALVAAAARDVVVLAHGSPDPRHARDIDDLVCRVAAAAPWLRVRAAYLDHHGPTVTETAAALTGPQGPAVVVPALVTRAYHSRIDIPRAASELARLSGRAMITTEALGTHRALAEGVRELLGGRPEPRAVVMLAGSTETDAVDDIVSGLRAGLGRERTYAFATLDDHLPIDAAVDDFGSTDGVVAVAAVIADGVLRDRMARRCAARGIPLVDGALARTRALVDLVLSRVRSESSLMSGSRSPHVAERE